MNILQWMNACMGVRLDGELEMDTSASVNNSSIQATQPARFLQL